MGERASLFLLLSPSLPRGAAIEYEKEHFTIIAEVPGSRRAAERETRSFGIINNYASRGEAEGPLDRVSECLTLIMILLFRHSFAPFVVGIVFDFSSRVEVFCNKDYIS